MTKIRVSIKGAAPYMQHKFTPGKGGVTVIPTPEDEAERAVYRDKDGNYVIPASHLEGAMIKAGTDIKQRGRKTYKEFIKAGCFVEPAFVKMSTPGYEIDTRNVRVQRATIMRARPRFDEWEADFDLVIQNDEQISPEVAKMILERAGEYYGIGDFRPRYGRFTVTKFDHQ